VKRDRLERQDASLALSIGLISLLNRREELTVPSWLLESISTGMAV
jgi:hypothetical protein